MANYWRLVNKVINEADILLLVIDARLPELTRNSEIEEKITWKKKKILYVINKCDLVSKFEIKVISKDFNPCVFVSSKEKFGGTKLFRKIMELSRGETCVVGVLGFPNVGKSSVINMLKGRKSAPVSSQAGHTRGIQFVKAKRKIKLIDTPGVLQYQEKDMLNQVLIGAVNPSKLKDPEYFAMRLIEKYPKHFEKYYGTKTDDSLLFLDKVAKKKNILIKGGNPDTKRISKMLILDWQMGKVHATFNS